MDLFLYPNPTAQFYALINAAQYQAAVHLTTDIESYLVFLLMRFSHRPDMIQQNLGLGFLEALEQGYQHPLGLKEVADSCLLFAGLFPEHAQKKRVPVRYFIQVGQSAYSCAAEYSSRQEAQLYIDLSTEFVNLAGVLQATREQHSRLSIEAWIHSLNHSPTTH